MSSFRELLTEGRDTLAAAGKEEAEFDARALLLFCTGLSWSRLLLRYEEEADAADAGRFSQFIRRRAAGEPLQYITGSQDFCGIQIKTDRRALIPRQDTEVLVETALRDLKGRENLSLLDLCTGSGCIAAALKALGPFSEVTAADLSEEALSLAGENLPAGARLIRSDLFQAPELAGALFDVITCNPPYIPSEVIETLSPEVKDYEPRMALDGSADGLLFYRRLSEDCPRFLRPGGRVYFEIGADQGPAVAGLLSDAGFSEVRVVKDLQGLDRVVCGIWTK